jgi:kinesin family protein 5
VKQQPGERCAVVSCSMLEIYKETLQDLLSLEKRELKIKESVQEGIFVENLTRLTLKSEEELLRIVEMGEQTRRVAATRINSYSSRSHTIFQLTVTRNLPVHVKAHLNLVDLAGSEKVAKSGASGDTLEEAKKINLSLSCLGNVIHAIIHKLDHVPYRDSKLTRLL